MITETGNLFASDAADNDRFGAYMAVSRDGLVMAVGMSTYPGAPGADKEKVYIYDNVAGSWVERYTVSLPETVAGDEFGSGLSLNEDGTLLLVCARRASTGGVSKGVAYVISLGPSSFSKITSFSSADGANGDLFGTSSCMSGAGDFFAIGAQSFAGGGTARGKVYIYSWNGSTATEIDTLSASDAGDSDLFGVSCACDYDFKQLIVGAHFWDTPTVQDVGVGYYFIDNGGSWVETQIIQASDAAASDLFFVSCSVNNEADLLIAGSRGWEGVSGSNRGALYLFKKQNGLFSEHSIITPSLENDNDFFGVSCGMTGSGAEFFAGTFAFDNGGTDRGTVFLFKTAKIAGTITESSGVDKWRVSAIDGNGKFIRGRTISASSYEIAFIDEDGPVFISLMPFIDGKWTASTNYEQDDIITPVNPIGTPHLFKCITSGLSGGSEPAWNTSGNTNDGAAVFEHLDELPEPTIEGPLIPA